MRRRGRNRRVVRQPDRVQTRLLLWGLLAGVVVLVPLLANIWGHAEAVRLGYSLEKARDKQADLMEEHRLLRAEHATLRDLDRIQDLATGKLGLRPRRAEDTVVVSLTETPDGTDVESGKPRMIALSATPAPRGGPR